MFACLALVMSGVLGDPSQEPSEHWWVFGLEDGVARLWEVLPESGEIVTRATLGESPWAAGPLFRAGEGPRNLVRWQRRIEGRARHVVELHLWDSERQELRFLARGDRLNGLGGTEGGCLVGTEEGILVLDLERETFRPLERPFQLLRDLDGCWLVQCDDVADSRILHLFEPRGRRFIEEFTLPKGLEPEAFAMEVPWVERSADGRWLAWMMPVPFEKVPVFGEPPRTLETSIRILDLERDTVHSVPLHVIVAGGSGRPVLWLSLDVSFDEQGRLRYADVLPARRGEMPRAEIQDALERIVLAPPTWKRVPSASAGGGGEEGKEAPRVAYVPSHLANGKFEIENELDLLAAFCERKGLPTPFRTPMGDRVGYQHLPMAFSPDGRRLLVRLKVPSEGADLLYIDLEEDRWVAIQAPFLGVVDLHHVSLNR